MLSHSEVDKVTIIVNRISLEELDSNASAAEDTKRLIDPISLQLMLIPLKPNRASRLQAVELGSLVRHLEFRGNARAFHPLNPNLKLTWRQLENYVLDEACLAERDAYLEGFDYSREEFLAYRGLTRREYQRLLLLFQQGQYFKSLMRVADFGLPVAIAALGLGGYLAGSGSQNLFFSHQQAAQVYSRLQSAAALLSVTNVALAQAAWHKKQKAEEVIMITCFGFLIGTIMLFAELHLMTKDSALKHDDLTLQGMEGALQIVAKLAIPYLQGGLLIAGQTALARFSLFAKTKTADLVRTYMHRAPLEPQAPQPVAPRPKHCTIL